MKRKTRLQMIPVLFSLVASMAAMATPALDYRNEEPSATTGATYALSPDAIIALESAALEGDRIAAFRLYQYYAYSNYDTMRENRWMERAAQLGHPVAQYKLAQRFLEKQDFHSAHHWAERLQARDPKRAKQLLAEIKSRQAAATHPSSKPSK